jgi:hypothetical protein
VYHQNLCGISNKKSELELYLNSLPEVQHFVCVSEHFLNKLSAPLLHLPEYYMATYNVRTNKKRGGTLILACKDRKTEELQICRKIYSMESFEVCGIRDCETNICVICCYRSPRDSNLGTFMEKLEQILNHFFGKKCLICGDFNINLLSSDDNSTALKTLLKCYNFRYLVTTSTYKRNDSQSCIDNVFTNLSDSLVSSMEVDHNGLADGHAGLLCRIVTNARGCAIEQPQLSIRRERRCYNVMNNNNFRQKLMSQNWQNLGINTFIRKFTDCFKNSFKKTQRVTKSNTKLKWITKGLRTSSKMKRFLTFVNKEHLPKSTARYRAEYLKTYRQVIRNAKKHAVQAEIVNAKNSSKAIWKVVNQHRNKKPKFVAEKLLLKTDTVVSDPLEQCDIFCKIFDHSGGGIANHQVALTLLVQHVARVPEEMTNTAVTPHEIARLVKMMESKSSVGYDGIPIRVIKDNIDLLAGPLSDFYNNCFELCIFPDQLKIARVLPIHKKGSTNNPNNYRPISLLPTLSKIFEKLLKDRLLDHINRYKILNKRQFGYQKGVGTCEAIDELIKDTVLQLNSGKKVAGVFLDLSAAFDTVDHSILLSKLEHYGVRGNVFKLYESYLRNRKQFVELKHIENKCENVHKSRMIDMNRGVPQGSILGPIFFVIFVNDLINYMQDSIPSLQLVVFADDTNAVMSADCITKLNQAINRALTAFSVWFSVNNLTLNSSKTKSILFKTNPRCSDSLLLEMNGKVVETVEVVKFLGVLIDSNLNWKAQLQELSNSIGSACFALRSLREEIKVEQLKMVYYALIESKLRYSIKLWGNSYLYNTKIAFTMQKRAIRIIVRIPQWVSCREHFQKLKVLTVPCLYIQVLLTGLVKHLNETESEEDRVLRLATRRKNLKNSLIPKLRIVKHSAHYQAEHLFNKLPVEFRQISNVNVFKRKLKALLVNKCYYSIDEFVNDM